MKLQGCFPLLRICCALSLVAFAGCENDDKGDQVSIDEPGTGGAAGTGGAGGAAGTAGDGGSGGAGTTPGITVEPTTGLTTSEIGEATTFAIVLDTAPTADVIVGLTSSDATEGTVIPASVTFTEATWDSPQVVTVIGVDDGDEDGPIEYQVVTAPATSADSDYDGLDADDVTITNQDDDKAGVVVSPTDGLRTTEPGGTDEFLVKLTAKPTADVTISLTSSDTSEGTVSLAELVFTPDDWAANHWVTVEGVDDDEADGPQAYKIVTGAAVSDDDRYGGVAVADVDVLNVDDESAGLTVTPLDGLATSEGGASDTFTVVLNTLPSAEVRVPIISRDTSEGVATPATLTFTTANWNAPQTVTVTGQDDAAVDGTVVYTIDVGPPTSQDANYAALSVVPVEATNQDNESAGVSITVNGAARTTEWGGSATVSVRLNSQPSSDVALNLSTSDPTEGQQTPSVLVFTPQNWDADQIVILTGQDDTEADGEIPYRLNFAAPLSSDPNYQGLPSRFVDFVNVDNETAGVSVSPVRGLQTTESGGTATFEVSLNSPPTQEVVVPISSDDALEGVANTARLTFTISNWSAPQTVTVTGVDDLVADGSQAYMIVVGAALSPGSAYDGVDGADVAVTNIDNDSAGFTPKPQAGLQTTEDGGKATFTLVLNSKPSADVTVPVATGDATEATVSPASLTFTTTNWNAPQTVTVTGVDDAVADGNQSFKVLLQPATSADAGYNGVDPPDVDASNIDNDSAGISVTAAPNLTTTESGAQASFEVVLNSRPTADVSIGLSTSDPGEGTVEPTVLTFTPSNWNAPQTVTATGVDDAFADGNQRYFVVLAAAQSADPGYEGRDALDVEITNIDNDSAGVLVTTNADVQTSESGGTATFNVVLNTQPALGSVVVIKVVSGDPTEGSPNKATLTFNDADWSAPQTVTVTGVDDAAADGDQPYTILLSIDIAATTDGAYDPIEPDDVVLTNIDNDSAGVQVRVTDAESSEDGDSASFDVVLNSLPGADVVITVSSQDTSEGTPSPTTLTFTPSNWNAPQKVTVTGQDDAVADGNQVYTIVTSDAASSDAGYSGLDVKDVVLTNTDNDSAGVTVADAVNLETNEFGLEATFSVRLNSQPTSTVTIAVTSLDTTEGTVSPGTLTFTTADWNSKHWVTVTGVEDAVADGNQVFTVDLAATVSSDGGYSGVVVPDVSVTNWDNDSAGVKVTEIDTETSEAGDTARFTVALNSQPTADVTIGVSSSDTGEGTPSPTTLTFTAANWNAAQTVTVTGVDDAVADGNQLYTIVTGAAVSSDGGYSGRAVADVALTNTDNDSAGITVADDVGLQTDEAGQTTATFSVVLNSQPTATVTIDVSSLDTTEGSVSPSRLTFTTLDYGAKHWVTVTGVNDAGADGDQVFTVALAPASSSDSSYNGLDPRDVSVTNLDNDSAGVKVTPLDTETTESGDDGNFEVVLNSQPAAGRVVVIDVTSGDTTEGIVSPASLTFTDTNWAAPKTVTVTGVDDDAADGDQTYTVQVDVNAVSTTDNGYDSVNPNDVTLKNIDNDSAGVTVADNTGLQTSESGLLKPRFSVVLNSKPAATVTIQVSSKNAAEGSVSPTTLTFTTSDWNSKHWVTVTGVDDSVADGDQVYTVDLAPASSSDSGYSGIDPPNVSVTNLDNDSAGVQVTAIDTETTESGEDGSFAVVLNSQPAAGRVVVINIASGDTTEGTVSPATLTFTDSNWNGAQTVTVTGVDDAAADGDRTYTVTVDVNTAGTTDAAYDIVNPDDVVFKNIDNDSAGITVADNTNLQTSESGLLNPRFSVVLNSQPSGTVTIAVSSRNTAEGTASPSTLTFTTSDWSSKHWVTLTGVNDAVADGNQVYTIDLAPAVSSDSGYNGLDASNVTVTNLDNDSAGVTVTPIDTETDEGGDGGRFEVVLNSQPAAGRVVVIDLASTNTAEGTVSPASLTFTDANWNGARSVTVTGVDDSTADGDQTYVVTVNVNAAATTENGYDPVNPNDVTFKNIDNDSAGITVADDAGLQTSESGQLKPQFSVVLNSRPLGVVQIAVSSKDATEGSVSPTVLTFNTFNWGSKQWVTVTGVDDAVADGNQVFTVDLAPATSTDSGYNGVDARNVSVTNLDNDSAGVNVTARDTDTDEGGDGGSFDVVLNSQPATGMIVVIRVASGDTSEGTVSPATLTFTDSNWNGAQTVTVTGVDDSSADGDQTYTVSVDVDAVATTDNGYDSVNPNDVTFRNIDNDSAGITVADDNGLQTSESGQLSPRFSVVLNSQPSSTVTIAVSSKDTTEGSVSPTTLTFTTNDWSSKHWVTVTGVNDAVADGDQQYTVDLAPASSSDSGYNGLDARNVVVTNLDNDSEGVLVTATDTQTDEGGDTGRFTVVLSSQPAAGRVVVIDVGSSDTTEGTVSPATLTFTDANWNGAQTVTATGVDDASADGDQTYTVTVDVNAIATTDNGYDSVNPNDVTFRNIDNDSAGITVADDTNLQTSESGLLKPRFSVVLNSQPSSTVTVVVSSKDTSEGTVSPTTLTFTTLDWSSKHWVTVTGVDDAVADGNQQYTVDLAAALSSDAGYNGLDPRNVVVTNLDNDSASVSVTPIDTQTDEGGDRGSFQVVLNSQPQPGTVVVISIASLDTGEGTVTPSSMTFDPDNWNGPQTATVTGVNDSVADGDQTYTVTVDINTALTTDAGYDPVSVADVTMTNVDDDSAGIQVVADQRLQTSETQGSSGASFSVRLNSQPTNTVTIDVESSDVSEGQVNTAQLTFTTTNWAGFQTVTATGVDDPIADGDQVYAINLKPAVSADTAYNGLDPENVAFTNIDNDTANVLVFPPAKPTTNESDVALSQSSTVGVQLSSQPQGGVVVVTVASSDTGEGTVSPSTLTFNSSNWNNTQSVTVTGVEDSVVDGNQLYTVALGINQAATTDNNFDGVDPTDVSFTNYDNDTAAIDVSRTSGLWTKEDGTSDTFTVSIATQPASGENVQVAFRSTDTGEGTVSPSSVTFTSANWQSAQTVTVTGVDDNSVDGNIGYTITTDASGSTDSNYASLSVPDVSVTNEDLDAASVIVSPTSGLITSETGTSAQFTVVLGSAPTFGAIVTMAVSSSDTGEGTVSASQLVFNSINWNTAQTVTVTGVNDSVDDDDQVYYAVVSAVTSTDSNFDGVNPDDVQITNADDNDSAGFVVTMTSTSAETTEWGVQGQQASFTVELTSEPTSNVTVSVASDDTTEGTASVSTLVFTPSSWGAQEVVVTGVDDSVYDGDVPYTIRLTSTTSDPKYQPLDPNDFGVTNLDNDRPTFTITPTSGLVVNESRTKVASFTVALDYRPTANVTLDVSTDDSGEGSVSPTSLTFTSTNYGTAQTVTVNGVNDSVDDGDQTFNVVLDNIQSADPDFDGLNPEYVSVTNEDDDVAGITFNVPGGSLTTDENGMSDTFTVVLNTQPTANVTLAFRVTDTSEGSITLSTTFTAANWSTPRTITVKGVDDSELDGDMGYAAYIDKITGAAEYLGVATSSIDAVNLDNEFDVRRASVFESGDGGATCTSTEPDISADGRFVVFTTCAGLTTGDTNRADDVYLWDSEANRTQIISWNPESQRFGNADSDQPAISADGNVVAFRTASTKILGEDTNGAEDIYVLDRTDPKDAFLELISVPEGGGEANGRSSNPRVSADGRYVSFYSDADNLLGGEGLPPAIYLRDRKNRATSMISLTHAGKPPSEGVEPEHDISEDGMVLAFASKSDDLVPNLNNRSINVYRRDLNQSAIWLVSDDVDRNPEFQADGDSRDPTVSGDGNVVAFESLATNLVTLKDDNGVSDVYTYNHNVVKGAPVVRISLTQAGAESTQPAFAPSISEDGKFVVFQAGADPAPKIPPNPPLVFGDDNSFTDIYRAYAAGNSAGPIELVSVGYTGELGNGRSWNPSCSGDGRIIAYESWADNLVEDDIEGVEDIIVAEIPFGEGFGGPIEIPIEPEL